MNHACLFVASTFIAVGLSTPVTFAATRLAEGDALPRQADLGFRTTAENGRLLVRKLESGSASAAGLRDGDRITAVDGRSFVRPYEGQALLTKLRADRPIKLAVERGSRKMTIEFRAPPRPTESIRGVISYFDSVSVPGGRLRTIVTTPKGTRKPLYPLLFTQWVSCGSIEYRKGSGAREILAHIARHSGLALVRVERSTDGDSEGPACHELDYDTEIAHYVHAFEQLLKSEHVDPRQVYVYGSSLGSTTAPLVARALQKKGFNIAGIAVQGGGAETYYERMLTFDRLYLERRPNKVDAAAIHDEMIGRARFHYEYLIRTRDPDDIAKDSSDMARIRGDILGLGDGQQYGRPYAWHQQAAQHNFLAAWVALDVPVLVVFNEFDQFEAAYGHKMIADFVNRRSPGKATYVEQKKIGHSNNRYASPEEAYTRENGEPAWAQTAEVLVRWLKEVRS